jgi:hypothetical protein
MFIPPATIWIHSGNPQVFCWQCVYGPKIIKNRYCDIVMCTIHGWIFYKVIDPLSGPKNVRVTVLMTIIIIIILHLYLVGIDDIWWSSFLCWWFHFIIFLWHYEFQQKHQDIPRSFHQIPTPSPFFFHKITITSRYNIIFFVSFLCGIKSRFF